MRWAPVFVPVSPDCVIWGRVRRCAVMCAEAGGWRCHRRIIADYLVIGGEQVFHILAGQGRNSEPDAGARPGPGGTVIYPPQVAEAVHE